MAQLATRDGVPLHIPVMLHPVVDALRPALERDDAVYLDLTCGMGGHAYHIASTFPHVRIIGVDHDADALQVAGEHLKAFGDRVQLVRARFDQTDIIVDETGLTRVDAILADLGLSSLHIDTPSRGFSYAVDAPLDMRMDDRNPLSAADICNSYSAAELARVFTQYGEQPAAARIAQGIVTARTREPITTSAQLVSIITDSLPAALKYSGGHPAKRIFQALRIEVNQELQALESMLPASLDMLRLGGRMSVLSYHSLEDRLVKKTFAAASRDSAPPKMPVVPEAFLARFTLVGHKAVKADDDEIATNPRAASVRMRTIERIRQEKP